MNFSAMLQYSSYFLDGAAVTIIISIITVILGTIIGFLMAFAKLSKYTPLRWIANIYIEIFRGTPMLVQLVIGFVFMGSWFPSVQIPIGILSIDSSAIIPGMIMLCLNSGAYVAEIVRGGIIAVAKGQTEAAHSLGLRPVQTMRYVIIPQALRNILPSLGNEFITLIKDSSLLAYIGINDLMGAAEIVRSRTYIALAPLIIAAMIYFVMTFATSRAVLLLEKKLGKGYQR